MYTIKVAILCNASADAASEKTVKHVEQYVPVPDGCGLTVKTICTTDLSAKIMETLAEMQPDLIINYGFSLGTFWANHTGLVRIGLRDVPVVLNNTCFQELIYGSKVLANEVFPEIKKHIGEISLKRGRPSNLKIAKTEADLIYLRDRCFKEPFGFDTETNFLNPFIKDPEPKLLCYSLAWLSDEEEGWCIPTSDMLMTSGACEYSKETVLRYTEEILFEPEQPMFIHNAAYDLLVLFELFGGKKPKNFMADTMVLTYLYHHANKSAALKENTQLVGLPSYKDPVKEWIEAQPKEKGKSKKSLGFEDVPLDVIAPYAAMDAIAVVRLLNFMKKNLAKSLWSFYYQVPHKVIKCANELACEGYTLSRDRFFHTKFSLEVQIREAYKLAIDTVSDYITPNFNIGSNQQLAKLMFDKDKLNLPVFNKTDGGEPSTGQKTLDDLMLFHPFIFRLSKLKKLQKLYSTYSYRGYAGVLNQGSRHFKRVTHWTINAQYKQTNRTARLASSNMNQHHGIKKKGGNVLTLPSSGSMVKQYFSPNVVAEAENLLYQKIVDCLSDEDKLKLEAKESYDIAVEVKPAPPEKKPRKKKSDATTSEDVPADTEQELQ